MGIVAVAKRYSLADPLKRDQKYSDVNRGGHFR